MAASYIWIGKTGDCPDKGPYTDGDQISAQNRNTSRSIKTNIRITTSGAAPTYMDREDTIPPGGSVLLITCSINPTSNTRQSATLLGAEWA
jgi:hypothetical protein